MKIERRFTTKGQNPFDSVESVGGWVKRTSRITQPDGSIVFEMKDAEVPASWSQLATDIMVSKYFRKAGVPQVDADGQAVRRADGSVVTGPEKSARQVIHRLAGCWRYWGETHGYFDSKEDAQAFYDELVYMMVHQIAAPNSPQWFNTGLNWAYGISGPAQGHYVVDPKTGEIELAADAYTHPQPHACFIQSIEDDLVNPGGIMDLWVREARLFKYGSGTGTNFSKLRGEGEKLSGGGTSSGLMSWLKIGDRAAAAIKSGGTTRRAAKMVCLDLDHPDIETFVNWKVREEIKVAAMVEGLKALPKAEQTIAKDLGLELNYDFNGEAYYTVSGQNSNNSVRIPDAFFDALDGNTEWALYGRTDGSERRRVAARDLWDKVCYAAWRCADPGVQFDSTINAWHTCPESGRINASNPCSEYMFLDNTACNLASINLLKFYDAKARTFDVDGYEHAIRLWTVVLEISVLMAAFPSKEIAQLSYEYRTLGLGFANIGAMLMQAGIAYDSEESRALCACLSAILTGRSYAQSALMARELGSFKGYEANREGMLRVIRNHRRAAHGTARDSAEYENLRIRPVPIDDEAVAAAGKRFRNAAALSSRARQAWDDALELGSRHGYRNAQVTVIAPTGTIGLLMDCDTTGVEPDFALVKFKKLAGGGYFKIANNSLEPALEALGYSAAQRKDIMAHVMGTLTLGTPIPNARGTLGDFLKAKGFTDEDLERIETSLPGVFELSFAFSAWSIREDLLAALGVDVTKARGTMGFNLLRELGLSADQIEQLNERICGTQTVEGAPHLKAEHLPVFDCANPCGKKGTRFIEPNGHIRMMAASQPFITGAISKTINLPNHATMDDIAACYRLSWELGLKANALYRDGCKLSQPLSTKSDSTATDEDKKETHEESEETSAVLDEVARDTAELADAVAAPATRVEVQIRTIEKITERIVERPLRRRLPDTRRSITHKFSIAGHEGYLTVGQYDDGLPGELFITMSKEGSTIGGLMDSLGTAISVALQYGVPLDSLVAKFSHQRFEPAGFTGNPDIPIAKSLVDYIFRWLGMEFIPEYRAQNAPKRQSLADSANPAKPEEGSEPEPAPGLSARHTRRIMDGNNFDAGIRPIGVDDPKVTRDVAVRTGPLTALQGGLTTVAGIADGQNATVAAIVSGREGTLSQSLSEAQSDAPACDICGTITVRNGTCYKCLNCGNSMGCS